MMTNGILRYRLDLVVYKAWVTQVTGSRLFRPATPQNSPYKIDILQRRLQQVTHGTSSSPEAQVCFTNKFVWVTARTLNRRGTAAVPLRFPHHNFSIHTYSDYRYKNSCRHLKRPSHHNLNCKSCSNYYISLAVILLDKHTSSTIHHPFFLKKNIPIACHVSP
jgi:hypothetical protein